MPPSHFDLFGTPTRRPSRNKIYERRTQKHLEEIVDWLARAFVWLANPDGCLGGHLFNLDDFDGIANSQVG